jgi:hypothetical protein
MKKIYGISFFCVVLAVFLSGCAINLTALKPIEWVEPLPDENKCSLYDYSQSPIISLYATHVDSTKIRSADNRLYIIPAGRRKITGNVTRGGGMGYDFNFSYFFEAGKTYSLVLDKDATMYFFEGLRASKTSDPVSASASEILFFLIPPQTVYGMKCCLCGGTSDLFNNLRFSHKPPGICRKMAANSAIFTAKLFRN